MSIFTIKYLLPMVKSFVVSLILLFFFFSTVEAQWQSVAPNLIGSGPYGNTGAMGTAGGVAWAGLHAVYRSTDKGLTWQITNCPTPIGSIVQYISFYDANTGMVCTDQGVFVTHDQGQTWQTFFSGNVIFAGTFSGSPNTFVVGNLANHSACFTRNGGATWTTTVLDYVVKDFYSVGPGNVIGFVESPSSSYVAITADYGKTWTKQSGTMEPDAHSFGVIPCEGKYIFGINEEGGNYSQDNYLSEVYFSKDGGASFKSILNYPGQTLSGCIAITPGVIYIPTRSQGILESIDSGATWTTVSGPNFPIDCHDIIAIDDTILLAADNNGSIWRTIDPRGAFGSSSKGTLSVSPGSIQFPDSVSPCGLPASITMYISRSCKAPSINGVNLSGKNIDSKYFSFQGTVVNDSLRIQFFPDSARSYNSDLELTLDDGSIITVPLQGFGKTPQIISLKTSDISTNVIGGTVLIPIIAQPLISYGGLDLSIRFDTSMLIYQGTFRPGSSIDQTTGRSVGSARVHFDESMIQSSGDTIGYAEFLIFPTHTPCTTVTFDSISIVNGKGVICGIAEPSFSSQICSEIGCQTAILSDFLRYGKTPTLSITPNPSSGLASLHSDLDLGIARISIFDQVGRLLGETESVLSPSHPGEIHFPGLSAGFYSLRIHGGQFSTSLPLLIVH